MRRALIALLLLTGPALLAVQFAPPVQATSQLQAEQQFLSSGFACGYLKDVHGPKGQDYGNYCFFSAATVNINGQCPTIHDMLFSEAAAYHGQNTPPCESPYLNISGESQNQYNHNRNWLAFSFLRFANYTDPNEKDPVTGAPIHYDSWEQVIRHKFGVNASVAEGYLLAFYNTNAYGSSTGNPTGGTSTSGPRVYATALRRPFDASTTFSETTQQDGCEYLNLTICQPGRDFSQPRGEVLAFQSSPGAVIQSYNPCPGTGAQNLQCAYWELDTTGLGASNFNIRGNASETLLDDSLQGYRPDNGFALVDQDMTGLQGIQTAGEKPGSCTDDVSSPYAASAQSPTTVNSNAPNAPVANQSTCLNSFFGSGYQGGGQGAIYRSSECVNPWVTAAPGLSGETQWTCWPMLVVHVNENGPVIYSAHLRYNQTTTNLQEPPAAVYSGRAPVNISLDIREARGTVALTQFEIQTSVRQGGFSRQLTPYPWTTISQRKWNSTLTPLELAKCHCEAWDYYRNAPLNLPAGSYWLNFSSENGDFVWSYANATKPNLIISNAGPNVSAIDIGTPTLPHQGILNWTVRVKSPNPRNEQRIDSVYGYVDTLDGQPVARLAALPVAGEVDGLRNGLWAYSAPWGRSDPFAEPPGTFRLRIVANLTMGQFNETTDGMIQPLAPSWGTLADGTPYTDYPFKVTNAGLVPMMYQVRAGFTAASETMLATPTIDPGNATIVTDRVYNLSAWSGPSILRSTLTDAGGLFLMSANESVVPPVAPGAAHAEVTVQTGAAYYHPQDNSMTFSVDSFNGTGARPGAAPTVDVKLVGPTGDVVASWKHVTLSAVAPTDLTCLALTNPACFAPGLYNLTASLSGSGALPVSRVFSVTATDPGLTFHVRTIYPPDMQLVTIQTPVVTRGPIYQQEQGAPVGILISAFQQDDPRPLAIAVKLTAENGTNETFPVPYIGNASYVGSFPSPAPGTYNGMVLGRDSDGNVQTFPFAFISVPDAPPEMRSPAPAAFGNLTPDVNFQLFGYALNSTKIHVFAGIQGTGTLPERLYTVDGTGALRTVHVTSIGTVTSGQVVEVRVVAADDMGLSSTSFFNFTVDSAPPFPTVLSAGTPSDVEGALLAVRPETPLTFSASDPIDGVATIEWRLVDPHANVTSAWMTETGDTATVTVAQASSYRGGGSYQLQWRATDVAGNVETPIDQRSIFVDDTAPKLTVQFDGQDLFVNASEDEALGTVIAGYRNATETQWHVSNFTLDDPSQLNGSIGTGLVPRGQKIEYFAQAVDRVGNALALGSQAAPLSAIAPPQAPILQISLPDNGTYVCGTMVWRWNATDPDHDPMRVIFHVRPTIFSEGTDVSNVDGITGTGTITWATSGIPDGEYEISVTAADPYISTTTSTIVEVANTATGAFGLKSPRGTVEYTDPVTFQVTLYNPLQDVNVVLRGDDGTETTIPLHDDGLNGDAVAGDHVYTAQFVPPTKQTYHARLVIDYTNLPQATQPLPDFVVQATLFRTMSRDVVPITVGALSAVGIGVVVILQLLRYGYIFPK
ncbi:MAG: choice-of-anchor X domain-containing protein [Thermoplasmatota archaeon]